MPLCASGLSSWGDTLLSCLLRMTDSDRVTFTCDGTPVDVVPVPGASLLDVLREDLGVHSVKDGCAPQGQCGCCTVLVDGDPRVACVTPVTRVAGRSVTTLDGLDPTERERLAEAFVASGGSQCGFCTPGILVRAAAASARGRDVVASADRVLAAHLCRCTGWVTIRDAFASLSPPAALEDLATPGVGNPSNAPGGGRDLEAAARRATLEGGGPQRVAREVPLGEAGFADDTTPDGALVAVPLPPGSGAPAVGAAGLQWVVGESLVEARTAAAKVQGRQIGRAACRE